MPKTSQPPGTPPGSPAGPASPRPEWYQWFDALPQETQKRIHALPLDKQRRLLDLRPHRRLRYLQASEAHGGDEGSEPAQDMLQLQMLLRPVSGKDGRAARARARPAGDGQRAEPAGTARAGRDGGRRGSRPATEPQRGTRTVGRARTRAPRGARRPGERPAARSEPNRVGRRGCPTRGAPARRGETGPGR